MQNSGPAEKPLERPPGHGGLPADDLLQIAKLMLGLPHEKGAFAGDDMHFQQGILAQHALGQSLLGRQAQLVHQGVVLLAQVKEGLGGAHRHGPADHAFYDQMRRTAQQLFVNGEIRVRIVGHADHVFIVRRRVLAGPPGDVKRRARPVQGAEPCLPQKADDLTAALPGRLHRGAVAAGGKVAGRRGGIQSGPKVGYGKFWLGAFTHGNPR